MSKLRAHNTGIGSALWAAVVCGRKKTGTQISCSGRRFGQRFGSFHPPSRGRCLGDHSPLSTEVFTTKRSFSNAVVSDPLSIRCFFRPGERPRRQPGSQTSIPPRPAHTTTTGWLKWINTHISTAPHSMAGPSLPSNLH